MALLDLSRATVTDPNSIQNGDPVLTANGWTVPIDTSVARAAPENGLIFAWPAYDIATGQAAITADTGRIISQETLIRCAATIGGTDLRVFIGLADSADMTGKYIGGEFDGSTPNARVSGRNQAGANVGASTTVGLVETWGTNMVSLAGASHSYQLSEIPEGKGINGQADDWTPGAQVYEVVSFFPAAAYNATTTGLLLCGEVRVHSR